MRQRYEFCSLPRISKRDKFSAFSKRLSSELQPKLVLQLQQSLVLLSHHLKLLATPIGTGLFFRGTDAHGHGHLVVLQTGTQIILNGRCQVRKLLGHNGIAMGLSTTTSKVVASNKVSRRFCIRLATATCSWGKRPAYSCQ